MAPLPHFGWVVASNTPRKMNTSIDVAGTVEPVLRTRMGRMLSGAQGYSGNPGGYLSRCAGTGVAFLGHVGLLSL